MFWIFLFIVFIFLMIGVIIKDYDDLMLITSICLIIVFIITLLVICGGINTYPNLIGERQRIESLWSEIDSIRSSHYEVKGGELIGGSLDNYKQSTVLSDYIKEYATKKADYNEKLEQVKYYEKTKVFYIFSGSLFIDKRVQELKKID